MTTLTSPVTSAPIARASFDSLRGRVRQGLRIEGLGFLAIMLVAYAVPTLLTDRALRLEWAFRAVLLASFVVVVGRQIWRRTIRPLAVPLGDDEMALAVERQVPEIRQALISTVQFERVLSAGTQTVESRQMMAAVVDDVRARVASLPFTRAINTRRVARYGAGLALGVAFFGGWAAVDFESLWRWGARNLALTNVEWPRYTRLAFTGVGELGIRIAQGDALTLRVDVAGPIPEQVFLFYEFQGGESGSEPMSRTGDGEFTLTMESVLENLTVHAEGGDGLSESVSVHVVERPRIESVEVEVAFPSYMEKAPEKVPATEGELRLPRGASLTVRGRSHKPIQEAFLLFDNDTKVAMTKAADGHGFEGKLTPASGGLLVIDVIDNDTLGAGAPPKLLVRIVDDKAPTIDFKMRGIGSLITARARIPGDLKVKDDFGLRELAGKIRVVADNAADPRPTTSPDPAQPDAAPTSPTKTEVPFEDAEVLFGATLKPGVLRYETNANLDLLQFRNDPDENSDKNRVRPGMLLSLRFQAKDNFGPGEPHLALGETLTFRVVTAEKLLEELRRRQVEQRMELERIRDEERTAMLEVKEMLNPTADNEKAKAARLRLKALSRQQTTLGRRTAFVGESYFRILQEFENNRLLERKNVADIEAAVTVPLAALAKESFPGTSRQVDEFSNGGSEEVRSSAVAGYEEILRRLDTIIKVMEQAETLAALIEDLKGVIKAEDTAIKEVEKRLREEAEKALGTKPSDGQKPDKSDKK
ncbi:MAG: hypothetical protein IPK26_18820 [Planctomycetes bacterium]|nr:hypothetical protein [Planctomycetota bacterium]